MLSQITRPLQLRKKRTFSISLFFTYAAVCGYVLFLGFPFLWMLTTSLKTPYELLKLKQSLFPNGFYLHNYVEILQKRGLIQSIFNSLTVASVTMLCTIVLAVPAGYAMARLRRAVGHVATGWILISQVFPVSLIIIPLFMVVRKIGLLDTLPGLMIVYVVANLPFALWMIRGYVSAIPKDLEEVAAVDGASSFKILTQIVLPLLVPGIIATSLFTFVSAWNEFFFALVLIQSPGKETLPLLLARFMGSEGQVLLGPLAAGAFIATIPSLLVFAIIQRKFATGLLSGAVKG